MSATRQFAIVTGASTGIGLELAKCCAQDGYDLLIAADEAGDRTRRGRNPGARRHRRAVQADLSTTEASTGSRRAANGRPVDALLANAGRGLGQAFLDQDFERGAARDRHQRHRHGLSDPQGRQRHAAPQAGQILITGSIAGFMPGSFQAVYNGTKAFLDSFSFALREELRDTSVTVTCLMPGATETEFFERADMMDTSVGTAKRTIRP